MLVCAFTALLLYFSAVSKHGILEVDGNNRVTSFLEKPDPTMTSSRLAVSKLLVIGLGSLEVLSKREQ